MPPRKRHSTATCGNDLEADSLAHPPEVDAQKAEIEQEDLLIQEEERKRDQEDEDYQYSSQPSSDFSSSQSTERNWNGTKSDEKRATVEDEDTDDEDDDGWTDKYSSVASLPTDKKDDHTQTLVNNEEPKRAKTPLFLPSSPVA